MASGGKTLFLLVCLAATACTKAQDSTSRVLDTVGNETSASYNKIRDYLDVGHKEKPKEVVKNVPSRYCYHTYQDIICYSQPLVGEEYRLVAFQNSNGKTGYTMPPPAMPEETVKIVTVLPPLKSVTVGPPPPVKAVEPKKQLKEIIFDPVELQPKDLVPAKPQ